VLMSLSASSLVIQIQSCKFLFDSVSLVLSFFWIAITLNCKLHQLFQTQLPFSYIYALQHINTHMQAPIATVTKYMRVHRATYIEAT
jgi:hypothetical protein